MKFNESLKLLRTRHGYSRAELADLLGVSVRTYQTYETGTREPNLTSIIKLAEFFDVSLDTLLGREYPKN